MRKENLVRQRLAALGLCAIPLLTYPLVTLPGGELGGIPASYLYLFGVWSLVVVAAGLIGRGTGK